MGRKTNYISDNYKIKRSNDILFQDIQDEIIILNMNNENYLGLDKVGARFWNILINPDSVKDAYEQLLDEFDVEPKTLQRDLNNYISELVKNDLVTISAP